jgi:hypothetical protein
MLNEERENFRRELTRLLKEAHSHLELTPSVSALVEEFIENYEFGLAYEFIMEDLNKRDMPAGDAAASLKAAAAIMGLEHPS